MRALMLHACFDGLGIEEVASAAFEDSPASNIVARRVGYEHHGVDRKVRDGQPATLKRYRMTRERRKRMQMANEELFSGCHHCLTVPIQHRPWLPKHSRSSSNPNISTGCPS